MAEKWPWHHDMDHPERVRVYRETGEQFYAGDLTSAAVACNTLNALNALEADKAALLEALEDSYTGMDYLAEFSESKAERVRAVEWLARYEALLARFRSEGAEVKAGE